MSLPASHKNLVVYQKSKGLAETDFWLEILEELQPQNKTKLQEFLAKNEEVTKMLTVIMKRLEQKK